MRRGVTSVNQPQSCSRVKTAANKTTIGSSQTASRYFLRHHFFRYGLARKGKRKPASPLLGSDQQHDELWLASSEPPLAGLRQSG